MRTALIGHTGFVGSNLARQNRFEELYNSKNIESMAGKAFSLVVCAGVPAEKWKANQDPKADRENIERLMNALEKIEAQMFILISTVDVYPAPRGVDEDTPTAWEQGSPYGRHRRYLEEFVITRFPHAIVRLPGLFGPGLKKNALYDLLHHNAAEKIHARSRYQFYNLDRLWADAQRAWYKQLRVVNLATEPVSMREVAHEAFGLAFDNEPPFPPADYDMQTRYALLFGGSGRYLLNRTQVLEQIRAFVAREKGAA